MSSDPRFKSLHTDPRFVRPKAAKNKLVLDDRFKSLLEPSSASASGSKPAGQGPKVDKYGRKRKDGGDSEDLRRYYRLEKEEEEAEEEQAKKIDFARGEGGIESSDEEQSEDDDEEEEEDDDSQSSEDDDDGPVTIGGAGVLSRRRNSSPEIDLSEDAPAFIDTQDSDEDAAEEDESDSETSDPTTRLAIVNMDWDHLRASDLFRVLASPLSLVAPPQSTALVSIKSKSAKKTFDENGEEVGGKLGTGKLQIIRGRLLKLVIYVSEFGRERIEREEREGPPKELFLDRGRAGSEDEKEETGFESEADEAYSDEDEEITEKDVVRDQLGDAEEDYDGEALRRYQLERLRYYYAIATFDNPISASHVLNEVNGTEFERTANIFDLQFVPEDTTFDDSPIHDEATESSVAASASTYTGIDFVTDALRHSKVKLTWDADDPHRKNKLAKFLAASMDKSKSGKGKAKEVDEDEVAAYLASSSDEDENAAEEEEEIEEEDDFFVKDFGAEKVKGKKSQREKMRSLFGLDKEAGEEDEDTAGIGGGKKSKSSRDGGMQITFAPALVEGKSAFDDEEDEEEVDMNGKGKKSAKKDAAAAKKAESSLETYNRKEKERKERKKEEKRRKKLGLPVGSAAVKEKSTASAGAEGFDDAFFGDDGDLSDGVWDADEARTFEADDGKQPKKKLSKSERRKLREAEERERNSVNANLALMVDDDEGDEAGGGKHFDMRTIAKAEKKGKKGKGKKKRDALEEKEAAKDTFEVDLKDDRFKSVFEDSEFAIDPTNPKFQKTKNTSKILEEGNKRRSKKRETPRAPVAAAGLAMSTSAQSEEARLKALVEAVKRKAGAGEEARGKRARLE